MNNPRDVVSYLPEGVAEHLGYYVYLYIDPRNGRPFYVGKGKGERILFHLDDTRDSAKVRLIAELKELDLLPRIEVLAHGLKDEETAFRIEAAAIDLLGMTELTNQVRGWKSLQTGRMTLEELIGYYVAKPVTVIHPTLLIRINQLYRHNMSPKELYETTRGIWKLGERRFKVKFALAVFEGVVREVYEVQNWCPALTFAYSTRELSKLDAHGRWEFDGRVASDDIRDQYRHRSVQAYFRRGNQSPTVYVNV